MDLSQPLNDSSYRSPANTNHRANLRQFRAYMHVLAGIFIALACLEFLLAAWMYPQGGVDRDSLWMMSIYLSILAALWLVLAFAACWKQMWAVYLAAGICYVALFVNLLRWNFFAILLLAAILVIAHIAISQARVLRLAGIPLTTKPHDLG